jgi:hypothetical protein
MFINAKAKEPMQSFLDTIRRPVVQFDVANEEHRKQMAIFLKYGTWGKCPYAFYSPNDISVKAYAIEMLAEFYLNQEFKNISNSEKHKGPRASTKVKFNESA